MIFMEEKCFCEYNGLEQDDTLYISSDWDNGIGFERVRIKYCPVCGKLLPEELSPRKKEE